MSMTNAPGGGRVFSGLLAVAGLLLLLVSMFLAFISGEPDSFWGVRKVELDRASWTCQVQPNSTTQMCERGIQFGEVVDKGSSFPITIALTGLGLIGTAIVLRLRPAAPVVMAPPMAGPMPTGPVTGGPPQR